MKYLIYEIYLDITKYTNNNRLAITMHDVHTDELFAVLTVNLETDLVLKENEAFVDTNNLPDIMKFIHTYKLGEPTNELEFSGFCAYPLFSFNLDEVKKHMKVK
jgi:hypothetical protein